MQKLTKANFHVEIDVIEDNHSLNDTGKIFIMHLNDMNGNVLAKNVAISNKVTVAMNEVALEIQYLIDQLIWVQMNKKTLDLIEELKKDYHVRVYDDYFEIDDFQFSDWDDDKLIVTYYKYSEKYSEYLSDDEIICHDLEEVQWWVNTGRDY